MAAPGLDSSADLLAHLVGGDDLLAVEVTTALGGDLVFELHRRGAGLLQDAYGTADRYGVAEAGVGVDDHGDGHGIGDGADVGSHLR
ncbi:hypothetical protein OG762_45220 [Streptomyces sp. NBC_01136]|nr:hypothetical protein OG762_45220 [Streptomyces sp. NBC_01136]